MNDELIQGLRQLERRARDKGYNDLASTFALEIERLTIEIDKSLQLLDSVLKTRGNDYNRIRAVVGKAELLAEQNRIDELTASEQLLLGVGYTYLYSQRLGKLFNRCHNAIWNILLQSKELVQLLRLFRHSSFLWRLRGETEKESGFLKQLESIDVAGGIGSEKGRVVVELEYFERRRKAVAP